MITKKMPIKIYGYASSLAAARRGSHHGPELLQKSPFMQVLTDHGIALHWEAILKPANLNLDVMQNVIQLSNEFANKILEPASKKEFFLAIGGDHSSAIGTWSAVSHAYRADGPIGLIWIDAHMDSHTLQTSETGNIHGMPLASLLGHGESSLVSVLNANPKLKPEHVCLIGTRSYERGEAELLKKLNVRYFEMAEIKERGLKDVFAEAIDIVNNGTCGYGISLDIDSIDPSEAPGTGVKEPNGLSANELSEALFQVSHDDRLLGVEIVEFDPTLDENQRTEKLMVRLMGSILLGKDLITKIDAQM